MILTFIKCIKTKNLLMKKNNIKECNCETMSTYVSNKNDSLAIF